MTASDSLSAKLGPETLTFEQKIPSFTHPNGHIFVSVWHDEVINFYFSSPKKKTPAELSTKRVKTLTIPVLNRFMHFGSRKIRRELATIQLPGDVDTRQHLLVVSRHRVRHPQPGK